LKKITAGATDLYRSGEKSMRGYNETIVKAWTDHKDLLKNFASFFGDTLKEIDKIVEDFQKYVGIFNCILRYIDLLNECVKDGKIATDKYQEIYTLLEQCDNLTISPEDEEKLRKYAKISPPSPTSARRKFDDESYIKYLKKQVTELERACVELKRQRDILIQQQSRTDSTEKNVGLESRIQFLRELLEEHNIPYFI